MISKGRIIAETGLYSTARQVDATKSLCLIMTYPNQQQIGAAIINLLAILYFLNTRHTMADTHNVEAAVKNKNTINIGKISIQLTFGPSDNDSPAAIAITKDPINSTNAPNMTSINGVTNTRTKAMSAQNI